MKKFECCMIKKRRGEDEVDLPSCVVARKKSRDVAKAGFISLKTFDIPLISSTTDSPCESICLKPGRPYSIGRNFRFCQFVFRDPRVSKLHCQILFDALRRKIFISDGGFLLPASASASGCVVDEFRNRLFQLNKLKDNKEVNGCSTSEVRASLNGVFVNGIRIRKGIVAELSAGDEVLLVCGNASVCSLGIRIGFVIERIVLTEEVVLGLNEFALEGRQLIGTKALAGHSRKLASSPFLPFSSGANGMSPDSAFSISESECGDLIGRTNFLLSHCKRILHSDDPISCIRECAISDSVMGGTYGCSSRVNQFPGFVHSNILEYPVGGEQVVKSGAHVFVKEPRTLESSHTDRNSEITKAGRVRLNSITIPREKVMVSEETTVPLYACVLDDHLCRTDNSGVHFDNASSDDKPKALLYNSVGKENAPHSDGVVQKNSCGSSCSPPGKKFYLNRLKFMDHSLLPQHPVISLPELLYPVESLSRIFIATFTSDILWFISYCQIPSHLPVTIACHNTERCWSSSPDKRTSVPYSDFPNLVVVYPPFPEAIAFGKDRKKHGIACHHPKLFVLLREDSIRVIITSANLVEKQWNSVINTVWWQDFPRTSTPDYSSLFTQISDRETDQDLRSDFAAQLAGFMASLVIDVPSQAHWIVELTKYDFGGAVGHLVVSIPGIHFCRTPYVSESSHFVLANQCASQSFGSKFLGSLDASVVGLSHLFRTAADSNGAQLKKLAAFLGKCCQNAYEVSEIVLRRNMNVPADMNAVSVLVPNPDEFSEGDCIQLGFLPRNIAKWVSPLWDSGFFRFSGYLSPKEALAAALGGDNKKVQLILYVSQGPNFSDISTMMQPEHVSALSSLIASIQRCTGLQRLNEVLGRYKWPELPETDLLYGSSSIGSSVNAQFLAAFSAAAGKRSLQLVDSEESDPEWGCWNASQESRNPSIKIIFPTIERVKNAHCGILPSKRILCFPERTWQRLRNVGIFHDAIPHPHDRVGHPMHVKVARRRFQSKTDSSSFGWVYCGSHNFSAAAWGRPVSNPFGLKPKGTGKANSSLGLTLHICNYELGIIFVFPPPGTKGGINHTSTNLDDIVLPFVVPAPKYGPRDRPATAHSMWEALAELTEQAREKFVEATATGEMMEEEEIPDEEEEVVEATDYVVEEKEEEKAYAEMLWSQVDSSQSC